MAEGGAGAVSDWRNTLPEEGTPLEPVQIRIAAGLARGRMNHELCKDLDMPLGTLKTHLRRMMAALGCGSRYAVVDHAYRDGYLRGLTPETWRLRPLTQKQEDVMPYLPADLTVDEIGQKMGLSPWTVKSRMGLIYRKYRVNERCHAVAIGWQQGIYGKEEE
jgi:DNA-binding NarL/FixJ family response regulator